MLSCFDTQDLKKSQRECKKKISVPLQNEASLGTVEYMTIGSFEEIDKLDNWVIEEYVQAMDLNSFPFHHLSARHSSQRNCAQEIGSMA